MSRSRWMSKEEAKDQLRKAKSLVLMVSRQLPIFEDTLVDQVTNQIDDMLDTVQRRG